MIDLLHQDFETRKKKFKKRWTPMRYHHEQQRFMQSRARFKGVPAGRRGGKTDLCKRKLTKALTVLKPWDDPRYFYGAPTEGQAKLLAWEDFKLLIPTGWLSEEPKQDPIPHFVTKFGSSLWIVGLDKPQRLEGLPWDGGVIDESCDVKWKEANLAILPALADRMGWMDRIGVPKRTGVGAAWFKKFCERAEKGDNLDEDCFAWPSSDILSDEQLKYYQDTMDAVDYAEQFNATWQTMSGEIFHAFSEENIRDTTFDPNARLIVGCDFNVDPMCWVLGHPRNSGKYIEWFDELFIRNTNTPAALTRLWNQYGKHMNGTIAFYGDATGQSRKTSANKSDYLHIVQDKRFRRKGATVHFPKKNPAKSDRFSSCNWVLCSASGNVRCFFAPRMVHTIVDVRTRGYKKGTKEPDDKGDTGHCSDAWGYPTFMLYPTANDDGPQSITIHNPKNPKPAPARGVRQSTIPKVKNYRVRGRR